MGISRSCTVTACFLIRYYDFNVEQAIKFIKSKRSVAFYNFPFKLVLDEWYTKYNSK